MINELTWLARNVHAFEGGKNFITVSGDLYFYRDKPPHGISFSRDEWLARRAELQNKPSWAGAPEWATHLAQGAGGDWKWFSGAPEPSNSAWEGGHLGIQSKWAGKTNFGEVLGDWRDTLERRPVDLSEPAGGVKDRGADGAEELNAMAQRLLVALKSDPRSFDTGALAEMVELADAEIVKRDAAVCGGEGYLNNHWFERGELPPVGTECEFCGGTGDADDPWHPDLMDGDRVTVIAHFECGICTLAAFTFKSRNPNIATVLVEQANYGCFRPIRTERDKAIDEMKQHCPHHGSWDTVGRIYAEALYDAGYRKQNLPGK
ncbi:hypothetical protein GRF56_16825 [Aeromonas veronii]|uniref:hypothetical protein n=1 Tax=Aeromonas veronii TaxID=654 RepID=UPI0013168659|nr:hypothetical protein [Aeromonas veronii]QHC08942.1 hypothetical protein GRF56_16825 [Aeromonas veronii]